LLDPFNHAFAEIRVSDQFALRRTALLRALMRYHPKITSVFLGKSIIGPEIAFDLVSAT